MARSPACGRHRWGRGHDRLRKYVRHDLWDSMYWALAQRGERSWLMLRHERANLLGAGCRTGL